MSDETDTTSEVAGVLAFGRAWYEATVAYHRAVEEAFRPLLEMAGADETKETGPELTFSAANVSAVGEPKRRLRECVENWPDAETGEYDPSCCRFPKSCSATVYSEEHVTEADLEPGGQPAAVRAARGASGGLGERLRALVAGPHPDMLLVRKVEPEWHAIVEQVEQLEGERAAWQTQGERWMYAMERYGAHRDELIERLDMLRELAGAIRQDSHCKHLANDIETLLDTPIEELRAEEESTDA